MTDKAKNRPQRTPVARRKKLDAPKRAGFIRRFVNKVPGAIEAFQDAGYSLVHQADAHTGDKGVQDASQMGSVVEVVVNKGLEANARTAVLMEIPEEFYREDQAAKQKELDEFECTWNPDEIKKRNPEMYGKLTVE